MTSLSLFSLCFTRSTTMIGLPYLRSKSSKWACVAWYVGSTLFSTMGGLGIVTLLSCVQNVGMLPLIWR